MKIVHIDEYGIVVDESKAKYEILLTDHINGYILLIVGGMRLKI
jgi:hypothetical protein